MIARLSTQQSDFQEKLSKLLAWESVSNTDVAQTVDDIIANIRQNGDQALIDYTNKFDGMDVSDISALTVDQSALKKSL
jgi:histidinol dehydrogenase